MAEKEGRSWTWISGGAGVLWLVFGGRSTQDCERCFGKGIVKVSWHSDGSTARVEKCWTCGGDGSVTEWSLGNACSGWGVAAVGADADSILQTSRQLMSIRQGMHLASA